MMRTFEYIRLDIHFSGGCIQKLTKCEIKETASQTTWASKRPNALLAILLFNSKKETNINIANICNLTNHFLRGRFSQERCSNGARRQLHSARQRQMSIGMSSGLWQPGLRFWWERLSINLWAEETNLRAVRRGCCTSSLQNHGIMQRRLRRWTEFRLWLW